MAKTSDWKIVATEGPTVDGRKITREWLTQIAQTYAMSEYTAMIWPEHKRFAGYGSNWGKVTEVKVEEVDGKMRLFAKLEPNQYLLEANKFEQKLFTSIEPNPDYKGQGKCYLMGIAVTDSPASSCTVISISLALYECVLWLQRYYENQKSGEYASDSVEWL